MKKSNNIIIVALICATLVLSAFTNSERTDDSPIVEINNNDILYKTKEVKGLNIFYREAGNPKNPALILLHGFPTSSHQYRKVLDELSDEYYLIAPDYPGFGESDYPDPDTFDYTFDNIANVMDEFVQSFNLNSYGLMMQDYGAPIGYRIATKHPNKVSSLIVQNGNIYEEGLGAAWGDVKKLWANYTPENKKPLYGAFTLEGMKWQYTHGTRNPEKINPDNWVMDYYRMTRPKIQDMNIDLFYDYRKNVALYPEWQKFIREYQPPILIVWGKGDLFFPESGAEAYKKDAKNIDYNIYDTGHFALEEEGDAIIAKMKSFLGKLHSTKMGYKDSTKESIQLLRNATLVVNFGGKKILIDPMFADKGEFPAFDGAGNNYRNPMVELPVNASELKNIVNSIDAVFVTHTHLDHWDTKAQNMIPKNTPIFVQPSDKAKIEKQGFTNVTAIEDHTTWGGMTIHITGGQHGFGKVGKMMGDVSGFVFAKADKKLYIAGDTRWATEVEQALAKHSPDVIVLNAGGAQFIEGNKKGDAITMTPADIIEVQKKAPNADILAVHMNTLNHCFVKRKDLKKNLSDKGIDELVEIPEDGDVFTIETY
ncbi:alpha/beta fold hydrolase [Winogradskyella maritima]|uniref:Alpha/beta fold hydrolase n=1 Tax=Winogradskyella maritima TaxID=1517766 RepID=A0ABV8AGC2_9FLAO|nr:alpha/beta fold hydrolase [Winogradskyella maritima]